MLRTDLPKVVSKTVPGPKTLDLIKRKEHNMGKLSWLFMKNKIIKLINTYDIKGLKQIVKESVLAIMKNTYLSLLL